MGLFNKIKDILFEDEEVEENDTLKIKEERKEDKKPIAEKIEIPKNTETHTKVEELKDAVKEQPKIRETPNYDTLSERDLFKSENTFPFPDFDEEEFSSTMNYQQKKSSPTNVLEYEKKKKIEKRYDFGRYERTETKEVVEKKKFKPSPIISPVYGILNEDYKVEDIKDVTEENRQNNLDIESVRKKAFGEVEILEEPKETVYEETVTVKLKENEAEKQKKVKTIDELLEDTADIEIKMDKKGNKSSDELDDYDKIDEELEEIMPKNSKEQEEEEDDTLENDLFDLIDSMYDNREDGDY